MHSDSRQPDVRFDGCRLVGLADLHRQHLRNRAQRRLTEPLVYKHGNWYNRILQEELYEAPTGYQLQVFHWSIESGASSAFQLELGHDHTPVDAISVIIGPQMEYSFGVSQHPQLGGTRCMRLPRRIPADPNDQLRMLPQCSIVLAACNNCSWYFQRGHRAGALLCDANSDACRPLLADRHGDDEFDDGGTEDVLFFRISMCKFRRTAATSYDPLTRSRNRMNVRRVRPKLATIVESWMG